MSARSTGGEWPRTRSAAAPRRAAPLLAAAIGLATICAVAPCFADDQQAFELAKNPYDAGQFAEAHARLSALLDVSLPACELPSSASTRCHISDPDLIERARALDAASLLVQKRDAEADAQIAKILRKNPQYAPNPALFPQEVIDRFTVVRGALRPELEAIAQQKAKEELAKRVAAQKAREAEEKWIADLQKMAGEEKRVIPNSRWLALIPFGIGQIQNGDVRLGVTFGVTEVLLGGACLTSIAIFYKLNATEFSTIAQREALNSQIRTVTLVNQITFSAWAAVTVAGVIQAQIGFVPERVTTRKRPVPPRPKVTPIASPVPGGAVIGAVGTF
jgi:hypothetical protein